jgi:hypothetical protein
LALRCRSERSYCSAPTFRPGIGERIAAARIHAQSFAKVLAEHTALTFDEVENTLREADKIRRNAQMGRYGAPGSVNTALRRMRTSPSGP